MIRVVIYSGGMDSFTLLHRVMAQNPGSVIHALSFDYGQRHKKELEYASRVMDKHLSKHRHVIVKMAGMADLLKGSSQTSMEIPVPHGHYAAANMKTTVVPGRNTIMLAMALGYAESQIMADPIERYAEVYYGAHSGDHAIYPDCRHDYFLVMNRTMDMATDGAVELRAPFIDLDKGDILKEGLRLGLDYSDTWSCYEGGEHPCGKCGACQERAEAFATNNAVDPTLAVTG